MSAKEILYTKYINVAIPDNITILVGNDYGRVVCTEQISPYISPLVKNIIVFPSKCRLCGSFINGMFDELTKIWDQEILKNKIRWHANPESLNNIYNKTPIN